MLVYGLLILLITLFLPGGVVGYAKRLHTTIGPKVLKIPPVDPAAQGRSFDAMDLFDEPPAGTGGEDGVTVGPQRAELAGDARCFFETVGLTKAFGGLTAVDWVDMQVREGEDPGGDRLERFRQDDTVESHFRRLQTDSGSHQIHG